MRTVLRNGTVLDKSFRFVGADIAMENGVITEIAERLEGEEVVDLAGKYVLPGLVDIHTHGCGGADACDGTVQALDVLSDTQGKAGVTSFLATSMTVPEEQLERVFRAVADYRSKKPKRADIAGINMEGPFFAESKKGAQRADCLRLPDAAFFRRLNKRSGNCVRLLDLAPELAGSLELIREVRDEVVLSIGHTACDYATAMAAIRAGVSHVTHLYNAMNGLTHRAPGVVGAASDSNVYTELISDGIHVDGSVVRATFKLMPDRVCLISDSMSAAGMPNGEYELGGQKVFVDGKRATLADGTIAGSATNLADCMRKAVEFGIPLETAAKAASYNPARSVGLEKRIGSIDVGLDADILVLERDLSLATVYFKGVRKE